MQRLDLSDIEAIEGTIDRNELPLITRLDEEVKAIAIRERLNKSQAVTLEELIESLPNVRL